MMGDVQLIEGAFLFGGFLSLRGRIVSLLGFKRRLPSTRPEAERSWLPMVAWAMEGTVSVSTVMLRDGASVRERMVERDEYECFGLRAGRRWGEADRCSSILVFSFLGAAVPAAAAAASAADSFCLAERELRCSVTLEDVTSFRSSSEVLVEAAEVKLKVC